MCGGCRLHHPFTLWSTKVLIYPFDNMCTLCSKCISPDRGSFSLFVSLDSCHRYYHQLLAVQGGPIF